MDPTTLLIILLFLGKRRGRLEAEELLLPIILLSLVGQGAWQAPSPAPPPALVPPPAPPPTVSPPPYPPPYAPAPAPAFTNLLPLLLLVCGKGFGGWSGGYGEEKYEGKEGKYEGKEG